MYFFLSFSIFLAVFRDVFLFAGVVVGSVEYDGVVVSLICRLLFGYRFSEGFSVSADCLGGVRMSWADTVPSPGQLFTLHRRAFWRRSQRAYMAIGASIDRTWDSSKLKIELAAKKKTISQSSEIRIEKNSPEMTMRCVEITFTLNLPLFAT